MYTMAYYYFKKSDKPTKKYVAIFTRGSMAGKRVYFGDPNYEHFRDRTGVNAWSHLDHNDSRRRKAYHARHREPGPLYSPGYFAWHFLW